MSYDISSLFSGFNTNTYNNSNSNSMYSLSDYAAIKNGSYKKLMKAYYTKVEPSTGNSKAQSADSEESLKLMKSGADALKKSANELRNEKLWEKKTKSDGTSDYDWDSIEKAVKSFVSNYNETIEQAGDSDTKSVLRNAVWLTQSTSTYASQLSDVGITIGFDNKLDLDVSDLKEADMNKLRVLFTGSNSYASKAYSKASQISSSAASAAGIANYTSSGEHTSALSELLAGKVDTKL